jgi:hypothetical protein
LPVQRWVASDSINLAPLGIFEINALSLQDSSFYLVSRRAKELIKTDRRFSLEARYHAPGNGPGELSDPFDLTTFGSRVFVSDFGQRKIVEFNTSLELISELVSEQPPMSLLAVNEHQFWMGSFDMEFEDTYLVDMVQKTFVRLDGSRSVKFPPETISDHVKNARGDVLRYRFFNHHADLFLMNGSRTSFQNTTQPEKPDLDARTTEAPVFKWKTHNSAFLTLDRACFLSGGSNEDSQPVQCFSFDGALMSLHELGHASRISVYLDSTLYTYSSKTNHIYVYDLGF